MKRYSKKQRRSIAVYKAWGVGLFALLLGAGFVSGLAFFLRPAQSELEKRELAAFPAFSLSGFWDGSWFADVNLWYADTFPGRESWIALQQDVKSLYGLHPDEMVVGSLVQGDEIAVDPSVNAKTLRTEVPDAAVLQEDIQGQIMSGLLIKDGAVYGTYGFDADTAAMYTDTLNRTAEALEGKTTVYSILVPMNSGVMLDEETLSKLGGSDQKQSIDYYYSLMNDQIRTVNTYDTLREHNDEYLYFRTDHHWTSLGAYYVYRNFCAARGVEPASLDDFEQVEFSPYLGSYYLQLQDDSLRADTVTGYIPQSTNETKVFVNDAGDVQLDLSQDFWSGRVFDAESPYDENNHYLRFINGDQPLMEIDNPDVSDGSVAVVVKESYGDCFVPFLVDDYDKVYVIDFRYVDGNVIDFCETVQATDLIFINSIGILNPGVANMYEYLLFGDLEG